MNASAFDVPALLVALAVSLLVTATLQLADRGGNSRRAWLAAGALVVVLTGVSAADLLRSSPRDTYFSTIVTGVVLAVLGALGMVRGTRRVRRWLSWVLTAAVTLVLLMGGLVLGAALVSKVAPF